MAESSDRYIKELRKSVDGLTFAVNKLTKALTENKTQLTQPLTEPRKKRGRPPKSSLKPMPELDISFLNQGPLLTDKEGLLEDDIY